MSRFEEAIEIVLRHEGGYVHDSDDPGGETNFGISKRSYPHLDIAKLTLEDAIKLYRRDWWDPYPFYEVIPHPDVAIKLFDLAVNMGTVQAVKLLQRATRATCGATLVEDGRFGPKTLEAVTWSHGHCLLAVFKAEAANFYRNLHRPKFEASWINRAYF